MDAAYKDRPGRERYRYPRSTPPSTVSATPTHKPASSDQPLASVTMSSINPINIGIIGFGNVGSGVVEILHAQRVPGLNLRTVVVRDLSKKRPVSFPARQLTDDVACALDDPNINVVVELIDDVKSAKDIVLRALRNGKHVVTANKALIATHGKEILSTATELGRSVGFRGTFVGCHPLIHELNRAALTQRIRSVYAVLSGTCNYILSSMAVLGRTFDEALKEAQEKGYAEQDPTQDLDGTDTAYKLRILFRLITDGYDIPNLEIEGIQRIEAEDVRFASELGYSLKLVGAIEQKGNKYFAGVYPALLPAHSLLGSLAGELNGMELKDELDIVKGYCAPGAGTYPTAMAVISDLVDIAQHRPLPTPRFRNGQSLGSLVDLDRRYYLRITALDKAGTLAEICNIFSRHNISIAAVSQKEKSASTEFVPIVVTTHIVRERGLRTAIEEVKKLRVVRGVPKVIRIIEPEAAGYQKPAPR